MARGIIVGKHQESWEKNSQVNYKRQLYILLDKPNQLMDGDEGRKVAVETARFDISGINIGDYVELFFDPVQYGSKRYAELVEVRLLGRAKLNVTIEPVKPA